LSKKAFEQAAAASVHLIAQVKANQPALHHAIAALCDTAAPVDSTQTADKKRRCRDETRTVEVFAPGGSLADTEWDGHIRAIIRVNRDVLTRSATTGLWRDTSETALFVSDVVLPAAQCGKAIRGHWHIDAPPFLQRCRLDRFIRLHVIAHHGSQPPDRSRVMLE
jgi:hypothetical protein